MLIRPANANDIPAIRALEQQADTAAHWSEREYAALFADDAPRRLALLAVDAEEAVGFAVARSDSEEWEIENVVVARQHRRQGIGRRLISQVFSSARQSAAQAVLLEVRESNAAARGLYAAMGFAEVGRRRDYYRDPVEDALLLRFSPEKSVTKAVEGE